MTKLLKCLPLLFLFSSTISFGQNKEVDSLITKISNADAYLMLTKTTSPRVQGTAANRIVAIGKTASPELIKVLDSQTKGVAAHFILSEIWNEIWEEEICCNIATVGQVELVTVNGLEIRIEKNVLSATTENLKKQQQTWKKIIKV